ncbi:DUF6374 family protein [Nocardia africana]|uniref:DUF6374 family protein n=1 Tax=Nocardia africana TaxID=134964 RepID=A0ABW6NRT2_9NOCA
MIGQDESGAGGPPLLDAPAFGKYLSPEQLENAAGKIAEGLRVLLRGGQG